MTTGVGFPALLGAEAWPSLLLSCLWLGEEGRRAEDLGSSTTCVCAGLVPTLHWGVLRVADLDLPRAFVLMAAEIGLWVILRPGPYICSEIDLGGLPR